MTNTHNENIERSACPNCNSVYEHGEHVDKVCPDCRVEQQWEMGFSECMECGNDTFKLIEQAMPRSHRGPDARVECENCGRRALLDSEGSWW